MPRPVTLVVALGTLLAACASPSPEASPAPTNAPATRAVAARGDGPEATAPSRALEAFAGDEVAPVDPDKKVALVIGNGRYTSAGALDNPANDAHDVAAALLELGFQVVDGTDLDGAAMREKLRDFAKAVQGAGVALFFYAGHGVQVDGHNYMLPVDAQLDSKDDLEFEAVDMNRVLVQLEREPRVNIIILDACRNNPLAENLARAFRGSSRSIGGRSGGLAALDAVAPGTLISFSTQPGATASDGTGRNSPYTAALLEHIRTPGLELQGLMRRVGAEVVRASDGAQVPWQNASLTTDYYLTSPPPEGQAPVALADVSAKRVEVEYWLEVKDSGSIEELQSYVERFPEGSFVDLARSRIKGLKLAEEVPQGADALARAYARLAKRSVVIENPTEPHEFYNNARLYDLRGDALNASKMYARYLQFGLPYVDPHLRYQTYLKAQEGRQGAREAYNELVYDNPDDKVMAFAAALLQPRDRRKAKLEALIAELPDLGPAHYELSLDYSRRRLGDQTIDDQRQERAHLEKFFAALDRGDVYRWFLDKVVAQERIEEAEERRAALGGLRANLLEQPMQFHATRHNGGWTITASPMEAGYSEVQVKRPGGTFESLGTSPTVDPLTGKPAANVSVQLPPEAEAMTLQFRYVDARGKLQGPFDYAFTPEQALTAAKKQTLLTTWTSWVSLQDNPAVPGNRLLYFTHLRTNRCGLSQVRYGLNKDAPDRIYRLPKCDPKNPYSIPTDGTPIFEDVPDDTDFVTVQVTFTDGTKSDVKRFPFR